MTTSYGFKLRHHLDELVSIVTNYWPDRSGDDELVAF